MRKPLLCLAVLLLMASFSLSLEVAGQETSPVYQQRSTHAGDYWHHWHHSNDRGHWHQPRSPSHAPVQQSSSFQRPYPYHLDYYRMRYGGSYAPYFGNLYGPPQVYAPSSGYYGGFGGGYNPGYGNPGSVGGLPYGVYSGQPANIPSSPPISQ